MQNWASMFSVSCPRMMVQYIISMTGNTFAIFVWPDNGLNSQSTDIGKNALDAIQPSCSAYFVCE